MKKSKQFNISKNKKYNIFLKSFWSDSEHFREKSFSPLEKLKHWVTKILRLRAEGYKLKNLSLHFRTEKKCGILSRPHLPLFSPLLTLYRSLIKLRDKLMSLIDLFPECPIFEVLPGYWQADKGRKCMKRENCIFAFIIKYYIGVIENSTSK